MRLKMWLWLMILALPAPFFMNCQRSVDHAGRLIAEDQVSNEVDAGDGRMYSFTQPTILGKLELQPSTLVSIPASQLPDDDPKVGPQAKASQESVPAIPEELPLAILVDNECLNQRLSQIASGSRKATTERPLGDVAKNETETRELTGLKYQAYRLKHRFPKSVERLRREAEADECVIHVANDFVISLNPPSSPLAESANASAANMQTASTNDPMTPLMGHLPAIRASQAWATFFSPGRGIGRDVIVAVIDSGIDHSHPDLSGNIWRGHTGKGGIDLHNNDDDPMDDSGHGTHVAGLIGAVANNGLGVTGVMGKNVKLMTVKVFGSDGSGSVSTVINGIRWAADRGAEVINLSMEVEAPSTLVRDAVAYATSKGAVVTIAAGNSGQQIGATFFVSPAGYAASINGAIAVASTDTSNNRRSSFSNFSNSHIEISAPGSESSSTRSGLFSTARGGGYQRLEGTSMASPLVAGAAALVIGTMKSEGLLISNTGVVNLLKQTARANPDLMTEVTGGAALDMERLARFMKYRYLIDSDAGTESPF